MSSFISAMTRLGSKFLVISSRAFSGIMSRQSQTIYCHTGCYSKLLFICFICCIWWCERLDNRENTQLCFYKKIRKGKTHSVGCCYWSGFVSLWRSIRLLNLCSITLYLSVHLDSHWWRTIQCAANSFSSGTSNRAGSNSSSRAVGLTLGSLSRHFWTNSYKKTHKLVTRHWKKGFLQSQVLSDLFLQDTDKDINRCSTFCSGSSSNCMALLMASWET